MNHKIAVPTQHRMTQRIPVAIQMDSRKMAIFRELQRHNDALYPGDDDHMRIAQFIELTDAVRNLPSGDYVEFGTYQGGSARWIWRLMRPGTRLYCFDTFDGFDQSDMDIERSLRPDHGWTRTSFKQTTLEEVRRLILLEEDTDRLVLVPGRIPDTLDGFCDLRFRFVHVDMDLYEPTRHTISWAWPRLVNGGVMIFHDYGSASFPGVKLSVDNYFGAIGLTGVQLGDFWGSIAFTKPAV